MEQEDQGDIPLTPQNGMQQDDSAQINISDVIAVIEQTDPEVRGMFNPNPTTGGGILQPQNGGGRQTQQQQPPPNNNNPTNAYVEIIEQPAPKAIRFRYECEGRSAGSIPGEISTPENKTYPAIRIRNYTGRAVVVVSCVTKDHPYRPHPHRLVGKEGCKKGVCTMEINNETMSLTFSNLGIQCVKKRDIEEALRLREEIRVDPFRTGFSHRNQPASIDLNAVRLCFQVFIGGEHQPRFSVPLTPVVSNPIYDKKGTSELVICKMSDCSADVRGGREIILLCEKVAKEDIKVRFYEVDYNEQVTWEAYGDFNHTNVHKQVAISFKVPAYHNLNIDKSAFVYVQLKRPSDDVCSEPLQFEYIPCPGRRTFLSMRRTLEEKGNLFRNILSEDALIFGNTNAKENNQNNEVIILDTPTDNEKAIIPEQEHNVTSTAEEIAFPNSQPTNESAIDKTNEWLNSTQFSNTISDVTDSYEPSTTPDEDKTLTELLEQVAELDEIYTEHQILRQDLNEMNNIDATISSNQPIKMDVDEHFDDTATYTSLQRAFKNPISMIDDSMQRHSQIIPDDMNPLMINENNNYNTAYDIVDNQIILNPMGPIIDIASLKREKNNDENENDEKLPPLPPKRIKKQTPILGDNNIILETNITTELSRRSSTKSDRIRPVSQPIIIMRTPDSPNKKLPPKPNSNSNTLPKQKKPGFFSKLFSRKKSKSDLSGANSTNPSNKTTPLGSREPSLANFNTNSNVSRGSFSSLKTFPNSNKDNSSNDNSNTKENSGKTRSKPVGRSVSSVSGKRPHLTPDIIHIPLKGDSTNSIPERSESGTHLSLHENNSGSRLLHPNDRRTVSALQLADLPLQEGNMELIAIADAQSLKNLCEGQYGVQLDPSVDLTEAEHYALYTAVPPRATVSEFDETSCYYAPVEAGEILTPAEVAKRLTNNI